MAANGPIENRLWSAVEISDQSECWPFKSCRNKLGYGSIKAWGRQQLAHRVAWTLTNGPIPDGMLVCHSCDNPACCNPSHLWLGDNQQNNLDMKQKKRARAPRGTDNINSKINETIVRSIRERYSPPSITQQKLADEYGISQVQIGLIIRRKAWAWVT